MSTTTPTFTFGKNWKKYSKTINNERINDAQNSLKSMLNIDNLSGLTFLDAGCGSGIFSLGAIKLKAKKVLSFDIDNDSTECARFLHNKYGPFENWEILHGSILDKNWITGLGKFNIVYSWGVLHHTGNMYLAFENINETVKDGGLLFLSIYNDQAYISKIWLVIKKLYNNSPQPIKFLIAFSYFLVVLFNRTLNGIIKLAPVNQWYKGSERGMNLWHDTVDWVGGYPFETCTPMDLENFFKKSGYQVVNSKLKTGSGCNEFVFKKND